LAIVATQNVIKSLATDCSLSMTGDSAPVENTERLLPC
uniref:Transposase n=1 Tax=Haemonchus placei TaxID=6290 RepID=A0A0N4VXA5_HAEPC